MKQWYVAKANPQRETVLAVYLARWDIEVFFPRIRRPGRLGGKMEALFPTYLFCRLDPMSPEWPVARWAMGLAYFLNVDGQPSSVPDELVEYLQSRVQEWNQENLKRPLAEGERISVSEGPFLGMEGMFQMYVPSRDRCRVLLETVSGLMKVELPERSIRSSAMAYGITL